MCIHVFLTKRSYCKQEYQYNLMLKTKKNMPEFVLFQHVYDVKYQ